MLQPYRALSLPERQDGMPRRCCTSCGQVLDETTFSAEVTFTKGAGGISTADGQFVSDVAASRGLGSHFWWKVLWLPGDIVSFNHDQAEWGISKLSNAAGSTASNNLRGR